MNLRHPWLTQAVSASQVFGMDSKELTESEIAFCELYINGVAPYAGNAMKCYQGIFTDYKGNARTAAMKLLNEPHIQKYITSMEEMNAFDAKRKKDYLARHLENIIEEASTVTYRDRRGTTLSPAALRSVAVQAMKLYSELYPVKEAQVNKINIEGAEGGVTFNVVVPQPITNPNESKE